MRRAVLLFLCAVLLFGLPLQVAAQGIIMPCGDFEGRWSWSTGGIVTIEPEGRAYWAPSVDASPAFDGEWQCDMTIGQVVLTWKQGTIDRLSLSDTGDRLEGWNQFDVAVTAERYSPQAQAPPAGPVPPMLVGTWLLEAYVGAVQPVWHIGPDGQYRFDAGEISHEGQMTAYGGQWSLDNETHGAQVSGNYTFQNWATLVTTAQAGPGRWHRRELGLRMETLELSGQSLPSDLPALAEQARAVAMTWRPDAILVELDYKRRVSSSNMDDELDLSFMSPTTGAGLAVRVGGTGAGFFVHDAVRWGASEIPDGFLDLPAVWAMARQHGLEPPLDRAGLRIWQPQDQEPVLAWSLSAARGDTRGVNLDGTSGIKLDGDLSGYVASYNEQWQLAVEGLKRLFQRPRSSSSSSGSSSWESNSSSSSSYDSDGGGSSSSGYDTASQGAWGAGDMQAYDRIQSGTATGDDCYRYGC